MMRRLFWRLFAAIWIATVVVLLAFGWITTSSFETEKIPGLDITRLQAAMDDLLVRTARELHREDEDDMRDWLRSASGFGSISVFLVNSDGTDLLNRPLSNPVRNAATLVVTRTQTEEHAAYSEPRLRARALHTRDGNLYAAVAALEGNFLTRLFLRRPSAFWANIVVAMIVSALLALLLAWYVDAPLERIRASAHRFANGNLDARVGRLPFGRSTEMIALANEFDGMAERIKALIDSHRRLVRDVSHELRSPLARQRVALELARGGDTKQVGASLDRIECESDRLEAMLAQALELSRLETATDAAHDTIALDALLEDVITNADYEGAPRGRKVVLSRCQRLTLTGSHAELHSAIENVIRNALAYTTDGTTVGVSLSRDGGDALISVRDHGPGVAPAELGRIFEPFYRTDAARNRSSGGVGLGLPIARRAIERHGGSILARNLEEGGLEMVIRLPLPATTAPKTDHS
jgi:two-component system sensor histidine kinase CpxA